MGDGKKELEAYACLGQIFKQRNLWNRSAWMRVCLYDGAFLTAGMKIRQLFRKIPLLFCSRNASR